jgi:hypothetical protein
LDHFPNSIPGNKGEENNDETLYSADIQHTTLLISQLTN